MMTRRLPGADAPPGREQLRAGRAGRRHGVELGAAGPDGVAAEHHPALGRLDAQADVPVAVARRARPARRPARARPRRREQRCSGSSSSRPPTSSQYGDCVSSSCTATGAMSVGARAGVVEVGVREHHEVDVGGASPRAASAREHGLVLQRQARVDDDGLRGPRSSTVLGNVVMPTTGRSLAELRGTRRTPPASGARASTSTRSPSTLKTKRAVGMRMSTLYVIAGARSGVGRLAAAARRPRARRGSRPCPG